MTVCGDGSEKGFKLAALCIVRVFSRVIAQTVRAKEGCVCVCVSALHRPECDHRVGAAV